MSKRFLIIGANSDIARACIPFFEKEGVELILGCRNTTDFPESQHEIVLLDVCDTATSKTTIENLEFDGVLYAAGVLPDNENALFGAEGSNTIQVNYTSAVQLLGAIAQKFKTQKKGTIVGITSAGAVRGKSSNVVYSSAKAGFDQYLTGIRQYLHPHGVRVLTIRPGYVETKMTAGMNLPQILMAQPGDVAKKIVRNALHGNRNIIYVKSIWRPLSWIIKQVPEPIFKRKQL